MSKRRVKPGDLVKIDVDAAIARLTAPSVPVTAEQKAIIVGLMQAGATLSSICHRDGMPGLSVVYAAMRDDLTFAAEVAEARRLLASSRLDRAQDVLDAAMQCNDIDAIRGAAVYTEQTLKYVEKIAPKDFGPLVKVAGSDGGALQINVIAYDGVVSGGQLTDVETPRAREIEQGRGTRET